MEYLEKGVLDMVTFSVSRMSQLIGGALLVIVPFVQVYAGCCAKHGGVIRCNSTTGYQQCKDGSASPSCKCSKKEAASTKTKPTKTTAPASTIKTKPEASS